MVVGPDEVTVLSWSATRYPSRYRPSRARPRAGASGRWRATTVVVEDLEVVQDEDLNRIVVILLPRTGYLGIATVVYIFELGPYQLEDLPNALGFGGLYEGLNGYLGI